jgi:hypothetical protein
MTVPPKMFSFFLSQKAVNVLVLSRLLHILFTSDFPTLRPRETLMFCEQDPGVFSVNR